MLPLPGQNAGQRSVELGQAGLQRRRSLVTGRGPLELALPRQHASQVVVGLKQPGIAPQGLFVLGRRFGEPPLTQQGIAQVEIGLGQIGPQRDNPPVRLLRLGKSAGRLVLLGQHDQTINFARRIGMRALRHRDHVLVWP